MMRENHPVEHAIGLTGIGGQGVQLVGKVLARAALDAGNHVMLTSQYGGEMRGGRSYAALVVGSEPVRALPVVDVLTCVMALHASHWAEIDGLLTRDGLVIAEAEFADDIRTAALDGSSQRRVIAVAARQAARDVGNPMGSSIALLGAFCSGTGLVPLDSVSQQLANALPPYRRQFIEGNERAFRAGAAIVVPGSLPLDVLEPLAS